MADQRARPIEIEHIEPATCTFERRLEVLQHVPFFSALPLETIEAINSRFRARDFMPDEVVYFAGDPAAHLYVVAVGNVKLVRHSPSGQDVTLDVLAPGDFFGSLALLGDRHYPDTAQAQTPCCLLELDASDFKAILESHPSVTLKVLELVAGRLVDAHEVIHHLSASPVEARVAAALTRLAERFGEQRPEGLVIQMPLSRQDVAELTGMTTETVSRVMSRLRKQGVIDSGREWVSITDPDRLRDIAGLEPR